MNLCSDGHEEIAHEGRSCPACLAIGELSEKIKNLEERLSDSDSERDELRDEVAELRSYLKESNLLDE